MTCSRQPANPVRAIALAFLATTSLSIATLNAAPAYAQATASYDIPAGPLPTVLNQFARQAHVELIYDAPLTQSATSPGLKGSFGAAEGLSHILTGTGLTYRQTAPNVFTLERAPTADAGAVQLGPVRVEGAGGAAAASANPPQAVIGNLPPARPGGQIASGSQVGMLGKRDVMDTPFSTTSYTAKTIQDQQAVSVGGVLNNDPSVRSIWSQGSYNDLFYIRGFQVFGQDVSLDGLYGVLPFQLVTTDFVERVEILKGPTALLNGMPPSGAVGGTINVVTKRAEDDPVTQLDLRYNSTAQFGGHIDFGRRFGANGEWGIRFNGSYRGGDTAVDHQSQKLGTAVLGLDYRGERFRFSLDAGYQYQRFLGMNEPVYATAGVAIPSAPDASKNMFAPWSSWRSEDAFGAARAEYDVLDNVTVFGAIGGRKNTNLQLATQPTILSSDGAIQNTPYLFPGRFDAITAQGGVRANLDTGPIKHALVVSASTYNQESGSSLYLASLIRTNLYDADWGTRPVFAGFSETRPRVSTNKLSGAAIADTLSTLNDDVQLTVGVRLQDVKTRSYNRATQAVTAAYQEHAYSPSVALLVKPLSHLSVYANYIQGLQAGSSAPSTATNAGEIFAPYRSHQYEIGAKYDFGALLATVSAFQITQPSAFTNPETLVYSVDGRQRNRGIELSVAGKVSEHARVLGGVSILDAKLLNTSIASQNGNTAPGVPDVQLNLGGEWDTPFLPALTLSGRVIYTSSQYVDTSNQTKIPDWTRVDIGARYTIDREGRHPITLRADIHNLLGKDYWASASAIYGLSLGEPRTFLLSASIGL